MSGSYTAFGSLNFTSNGPRLLAQISRGLGALDARVKVSERGIQSFVGRFADFDKAGASIRAATASMGLMTSATGRMGTAVTSSAAGLTRHAAATGLVATGARTAAAAMGLMTSSSSTLGSTVAGTTQGIGRATSALGQNAAAANQAAAAATRAAGAFRSLGRTPSIPSIGGGSGTPVVGASGRRLRADGRLGEAASLGVIAQAGQRGLGRVVGDAGALQDAATVLRLQTGRMVPEAGMDGPAFQAALMARAIETTRLVPGTTITGNLNAGGELRTAVMAQNAVRMLPEFQEVATALGRMSGEDPDKIAGAIGRMMSNRGSFNNQLTGELDPARASSELQAAGRMLFAYRNQGVSAGEMELFQRRARVMGERMGPETYFGGWTAGLVQSLRGNVAGTALNAFGRQMVNGIMPKEQAAFLGQYGFMAPNAQGARVPEREIRNLLARGEIDEDLASRLRSGAAARFNKRDIRNSDLAATRADLYFDWAVENLRRQNVVTPDERDAFANRAGSTNTSRQLWSYGLAVEAQRADRAAVAGVNMDAIRSYNREGFNSATGNMTAGVTNATASLGMSSTDDIVKLMNSVARGLNDLGDWARANPEMSRILLDVGVGLTGIAAAGVLFSVGSMAITGLLGLATAIGAGVGLAGIVAGPAFAFMVGVGGLSALGAGLMYLAFQMEGKDWKALFEGVTSGLRGMWDSLKAQVGAGPNGTAGAAAPTIIPGMGVAPNLIRPPGGDPSIPGLMPGLPSLIPIPGRGRLSDAGNGGLSNLASAEGQGPDGLTSRETVIHLTHMLDGRVLTETVTRHQARDMSHPNRSGAGLDSRMSLPDVETI